MSSRKALSVGAAVSAILALSACTSLPVTTDVNPNASVGACHTYAWAHEHYAGGSAQAAYSNPVNADRLRVAIQSNLAAHGIRRADTHETPDCVVGYAIGSRVVADEYAGWVGGGYGWGGWGGWGGPRGWGSLGYGWPAVRNEGRISVDLYDAKTHRAIWHASVDQNVTDETGQDAEARITTAVGAIFQKFPTPVVAPPAPATTAIRPVT
ncbi:MAG: DUF4136 domain-containing protein [Gammaproteobacteria bacterium]|nr:DUF4136 domain-containing protein [Gammaproteobacteria bacterium]